jgi:oxygen-independent coproporphyrinogen-3 oxidase
MLEQGTRYGASAVPAEDEAAEFYQYVCSALYAADVQQYEISNFARPGHRSRHNLKYWRREPYIGFGLDAHSMLPAGIGAVRFANTADLDEYLGIGSMAAPFPLLEFTRSAAAVDMDPIGLDEAFEESLFLGLRLNEGVDLNNLQDQFGDAMLRDAMPALLEVRDAGLLELSSNRIRLTQRGRLVSNEVFSRLLISSPA